MVLDLRLNEKDWVVVRQPSFFIQILSVLLRLFLRKIIFYIVIPVTFGQLFCEKNA